MVWMKQIIHRMWQHHSSRYNQPDGYKRMHGNHSYRTFICFEFSVLLEKSQEIYVTTWYQTRTWHTSSKRLRENCHPLKGKSYICRCKVHFDSKHAILFRDKANLLWSGVEPLPSTIHIPVLRFLIWLQATYYYLWGMSKPAPGHKYTGLMIRWHILPKIQFT